MSDITVAGGTIEHYAGEESVLVLRIYVRRNFTTSAGEALVKGLLDSDVFYKEVNATVLDGVVTYEEFTIDSTEDGSPANSYYIFALYSPAGVRQGDPVYRKIIVPAEPTDTTLGDLAVYSNLPPVVLPATYFTAAQILAMFAGLVNMAIRATTVAFGAVRMSFASEEAGKPTAVENYDPLVRSLRKGADLERYGQTQSGLTAFLAAAAEGATPVELRVTSLVSITENTTIPSYVKIVPSAEGGFTVAATKMLTINSIAHPSVVKQIFFGLGNVVLGANASGGTMRLEWWAAPDTAADISHAIAQVKLSQANGGLAKAGVGTWLFNNWDLPNWPQIEGAGMWDGGVTKKGTVFAPYADSGYMLKVTNAFRGVNLKNFCIDLRGTESCKGIVLEGTSPSSAKAAFLTERISILNNTTDHDTEFEINATDGAWECTEGAIRNCLFVGGSDSKIFSINTVNSQWVIEDNEFICGSGSTPIYLEDTGFTTIRNNSFGGVSGLTDVAVFERDLTGVCTLVIGSPYLNLSAGQFLSTDEGKQITVGAFTSTIKGLVLVDGLANRAHLSANSTINAVSEDGEIAGFAPDADAAACAIHIAGSHRTLNIEGNVDEGFGYFIKHVGGQLEYPLNLRGNKPQGRILVENSCNINSDGNDYLSNQWIDGNPDVQLARLVSHGDTISKTSVNLFNGTPVVVLDEAQLWTDQGSTTYTQSADSFFDGLLKSIRELPLHIAEKTIGGAAGIPLFSVASAKIILGGAATAVQPLIEWGRRHPITKRVDYYYRIGYNYVTGGTEFISNVHAAYRHYRFDAKIKAPAFQTGIITPDPIGDDLADYLPIETDVDSHSKIIVLSTVGGAWHTLSGLALPADPAVPDFELSDLAGLEREIHFQGQEADEYLGGITLAHENVGSLAANRFTCDWGDVINLSHGDRALLRYLPGGGWTVTLLSRETKIVQLAATVTYNNTAALAETPLMLNLGPGAYEIESRIPSTNVAKSLKLDFAGGGATKTSFRGKWESVAAASPVAASVASAATVFEDATVDTADSTYIFKGALVLSAGGTVTPRGAQRTANASDTQILVGAMFKATPARRI
jgi:hypothetical protein